MQSASSTTANPKVVCLVAPAAPWSFGPYQRQQYLLSGELHRKGYSVLWLSTGPQTKVPEGAYNLTEYRKHVPHPPLPKTFTADHITFIGRGPHKDVCQGVSTQVMISCLNGLVDQHSIQIFITLMDSTNILLDTKCKAHVIAWVPYHYAQLMGSDAFLLRNLSGVAALAPATEELVRGILPADEEAGASPIVQYIPHIIETHADDSTRRSLRAQTRADCHIPVDAFVVLMQGGNYEAGDRKGWAAGIQAFASFCEQRPDANLHLYLHALGSRAIVGNERNSTVPSSVQNQGVQLRLYLESWNLPTQRYTLDTAMHTVERVMALKCMADVCLHPSKTEGFGMNVLEAQSVGTPVVTTAFHAMKDFTRHGISVPPVQQEWYVAGPVATPNVPGLCQALASFYDLWNAEHEQSETLRSRAAEAKQWIQDEFSTSAVGDRFDELIQKVVRRGKRSEPTSLYTKILTDKYPQAVDWNTPWTLVAHQDVVFNVGVLEGYLSMLSSLPGGALDVGLIIIPCLDRDNQRIPYKREDVGDVHPDLPVLLRTHLFAHAHLQAENNHQIVATVIDRVHAVKELPEPLAKFGPA